MGKHHHNHSRRKKNRIFTSPITDWNHNKGFGFLKHNKKQLFLHRKDFLHQHKLPNKGDRIHFQLGTDTKGRECAVKAKHSKDGRRLTLGTWTALALLMLPPLLALHKIALALQLPALYSAAALLLLAVLNAITYRTYANDKRQARAQEWRTPERSLHILSIIGGWPAAFIAQRKLRHKISKAKFLRTFWLTPLAHILLALAYLLDWHLIHGIPR